MKVESVHIENANELARCPACNEEIAILAVNCPHCGRPKPFIYLKKMVRRSKCSCCHGTKILVLDKGAYNKQNIRCPACGGAGEVESVFLECCENNLLELPDILDF